MPLKHFYLFFLLGLLSIEIQCQEQKCKWFNVFGEQVLLDSFSVDVKSIVFPNDSLVSYDYDYSKGFIIIEPGIRDSILICYKTLPFAFHRTYARRTLEQYDSTALFKSSTKSGTWVDRREELFVTDQLYKSGSLSRGISFGNNQDVFVNSNLNLQMEGKLTSDINISAVITDQNIPFQPEGNTQQLQDFDRVFIRLFNENFSLSAGDVILQHQGHKKGESYFLQYYKNVQGGLLETHYSALNGKAHTSTGISVAKGKFASIEIEAIEGVQGPYRVRGPEHQRYIVIIAGSEKVFIDGIQMTRGYNNDYVVDYNLGEITFTNRVLITKFTRIRVDFEYSDQNYSRSILSGAHTQQWKKTRVFVNAYSEKENPNRPLAFDLTNLDKANLSEIGDDLEQAVISGIDSIGFSENRVLYKLVDTVDATGVIQQVLVFSSHSDSAVYQAQFTDVGTGNGSYMQLDNTLNGKVFQWVGVDQQGALQGRYEPKIGIVTPEKKQMLTVGLVQDISATDYAFIEAAFSSKDQNLYSTIDDEDNQGRAFKAGYVSQNRHLGSSAYFLSGKLDYEFTSTNFSAIDRFRYIEFDRDWSLSSDQLEQAEHDHIINAEIEVKKDQDNLLRYNLVKRKRGQVVDGYQHRVLLAKSFGAFHLQSDLFKMTSDRFDTNSRWFRWNLNTYYNFSWIVPGYRYQEDRNLISTLDADSVISSAMNYAAHTFYINSPDSAKTRYLFDFTLREDRLPVEGIMKSENRSRTTRIGLGTAVGNSQYLDLLFTYRNLENLNGSDYAKKNEENITARLDWQGSFLDRHIISELNYQAGNGRELKREFVFIQVPAGEGTHTWRDENQDGIQDLNEFYIAINPDERNYAKIFVPTDDYVLAFSNTLNYRLNLEMPRNWRNEDGFKRILGRISSQTSINIQRKITDDRLAVRFSPFARDIDDKNLLSSRERIRSTWFYNRSLAKYGFDLGVFSSKNKQLHVDGFEAVDIRENHFNFRYSPQKAFLMRLFSKRKTKQLASDYLEARNYIIREQELSPGVSWQPSNRIRLSSKFSLIERKNTDHEGEGEFAKVKEFTFDLRHSQVQKSTLNANITFTNIEFNGDVNTAIGYELLQALQPGNNILWSANWQIKIVSGLQLQFSYNGRKSAGASTIHTGRMQVNALF